MKFAKNLERPVTQPALLPVCAARKPLSFSPPTNEDGASIRKPQSSKVNWNTVPASACQRILQYYSTRHYKKSEGKLWRQMVCDFVKCSIWLQLLVFSSVLRAKVWRSLCSCFQGQGMMVSPLSNRHWWKYFSELEMFKLVLFISASFACFLPKPLLRKFRCSTSHHRRTAQELSRMLSTHLGSLRALPLSGGQRKQKQCIGRRQGGEQRGVGVLEDWIAPRF